MAEFDLSALMKDVSRTNTGREHIQYIPFARIIPDKNNGYSMTGVDELARSIEIVGLQQPLRVRPIDGSPDDYQIISGHRRHAAIKLLMDQNPQLFDDGIPCIVDNGIASAALRELQLLLGNADNRKLTPADEAQQAERISDCLRKLEDEGFVFPGRHRDWVSKLSGLSRSKIARLDGIRHNLAASLLEHFNAGELGITVAYRLSQESEGIQHDVYRTYGRGVNDLTDVQLEEAIARRKAPRQDPPIKVASNEKAGFDVNAYLANRAKEDNDFFEMLTGVADQFIDELGAVSSRSEGIELLKNEFGKRWFGGGGPGIVSYDSKPKGLTLQSRGYAQIFRTWTEVYDMLCLIALNRVACGEYQQDEDEDDEEPIEELPTVRWESRAVTPPTKELLLLYQLTNAGPKYTPAVYCGGAVFRKPAWSGFGGTELTGIAQQFSQWLKFPDPNSYGDAYKVVPPEPVSVLDAAPTWFTGEPEKDGWYAVVGVWADTHSVCRDVLHWHDKSWHDYIGLQTTSEEMIVERWYPLPEENEKES